jgi:hypothetical protein
MHYRVHRSLNRYSSPSQLADSREFGETSVEMPCGRVLGSSFGTIHCCTFNPGQHKHYCIKIDTPITLCHLSQGTMPWLLPSRLARETIWLLSSLWYACLLSAVFCLLSPHIFFSTLCSFVHFFSLVLWLPTAHGFLHTHRHVGERLQSSKGT